MNAKKGILLSLVVAVIAMSMVEVDPTTWKARESAKLSISKNELFKFLTDPSKTPEVKTFVTYFIITGGPRYSRS